jgi:hypothetical protein
LPEVATIARCGLSINAEPPHRGDMGPALLIQDGPQGGNKSRANEGAIRVLHLT